MEAPHRRKTCLEPQISEMRLLPKDEPCLPRQREVERPGVFMHEQRERRKAFPEDEGLRFPCRKCGLNEPYKETLQVHSKGNPDAPKNFAPSTQVSKHSHRWTVTDKKHPTEISVMRVLVPKIPEGRSLFISSIHSGQSCMEGMWISVVRTQGRHPSEYTRNIKWVNYKVWDPKAARTLIEKLVRFKKSGVYWILCSNERVCLSFLLC